MPFRITFYTMFLCNFEYEVLETCYPSKKSAKAIYREKTASLIEKLFIHLSLD